MYISADIAERIKQTVKERKKVMKTMLLSIGSGDNLMSNMKTSMPKADTLAKIADYLDCSVDYLLGRNSDGLSDDEQQLVMFFRSCSDDDCQQLLRMAEMFANDEKQARKKEDA